MLEEMLSSFIGDFLGGSSTESSSTNPTDSTTASTSNATTSDQVANAATQANQDKFASLFDTYVTKPVDAIEQFNDTVDKTFYGAEDKLYKALGMKPPTQQERDKQKTEQQAPAAKTSNNPVVQKSAMLTSIIQNMGRNS